MNVSKVDACVYISSRNQKYQCWRAFVDSYSGLRSVHRCVLVVDAKGQGLSPSDAEIFRCLVILTQTLWQFDFPPIKLIFNTTRYSARETSTICELNSHFPHNSSGSQSRRCRAVKGASAEGMSWKPATRVTAWKPCPSLWRPSWHFWACLEHAFISDVGNLLPANIPKSPQTGYISEFWKQQREECSATVKLCCFKRGREAEHGGAGL